MWRNLATQLLSLLMLAGCGNGALDASGPPPGPSQPQLLGRWTGQFPASEGDEGVELHFQPDFAFFVQNGQRVARQRLLVERVAGQLRFTLTSETDPQNQAVFLGNFAATGTIQGHYLNQFLDEDFDLTLVQRAEPGESQGK